MSTIRLLHLTDTHIAEQVGRRRGGYAPILRKWEWCCNLASRELCDLIVHTGDVFHKSLVPRIVEQAVSTLIALSDVPHVIVTGNHDYGVGIQTTYGKSIKSIQTTRGVEMGVTNGVNIIDAACQWDSVHETFDFHEDNLILATHKMVVTDPVPWDHLILTDLSALGHKVVLCGDYHPGWPEPIFHDGAWWSNPGALTRIDGDRQVRCALIDTDDYDAPVQYVDIPTFDDEGSPVVLPWDEIYDAESLEQEKSLQAVRQSLTAAIKSAESRGVLGYAERLQALIDDPALMDKDNASMVVRGAQALMELCEKQESDD